MSVPKRFRKKRQIFKTTTYSKVKVKTNILPYFDTQAPFEHSVLLKTKLNGFYLYKKFKIIWHTKHHIFTLMYPFVFF